MRKHIVSAKIAVLALLAAALAMLAQPYAAVETAAQGGAALSAGSPLFYDAPEFTADGAKTSAFSRYAVQGTDYRINAYYPVTSSAAANKAIESLVLKRASSFRAAYGSGSLDMRFTVYNYKEVFFCIFNIYEYNREKGLAESFAGLGFDMADETMVTRGDMFDNSWIRYAGGAAADYEAFAVEGDTALLFLKGGEIKKIPVADFSGAFIMDKYLEEKHRPEKNSAPAPPPEPAAQETAAKDKPPAPPVMTEEASPVKDAPRKLIAITYDDGPHGSYTPIILDALKKYNAKATFFVVGNRVSIYPKLVKRVVDEGHEIANHSYDHKQLTKLSKASIIKEMDDTNEAVEAVAGVKPALIRPPYGSYNKTVLEVAEERGMAVVNWDVDTNDWRGKGGREIANWVVSHAKEGSIVLMHDFYKGTAAAAPLILEELTAQGYTFVTVSELIKSHAENIQAGKLYYNWNAKK